MLKFHHAKQSRSFAVLWLLEELGIDYTLSPVDLKGDRSDYRRIQPHGKVPAIEHDGIVVTERAAITIYLCDAFPQAGLAPSIGDPRRGPYLSWLVFTDAVFDPGVGAHFMKWQYDPATISFGRFDTTLDHVERTLAERPYLTSDTFTGADVQMGAMLWWTMDVFKAFPPRPAFRDYCDRVTAREAFKRAQQKDAAL